MPKFYSLEQPSHKKVEKLTQELKEHPEVKPRLAFPFPLNENRRTAMKMLESGKVTPQEILQILDSDDFVEKRAAPFLLKNVTNFSEIPKLDLEKIIQKLKEMSEDGDFVVRETTAEALGQIGESGLPILKEMSQDGDWRIRAAVARALGQIGKLGLPILTEMSKDGSSDVREAVARALGQIGESGLPILKEMNQDGDLHVRAAVARALGQIGESTLPILKEMSKDGSWYIRAAVARALGQIGEPALFVLKEMSEGGDFVVREATAEALGQIGESGLPILTEMSKDGISDIRAAVARALGQTGKLGLPILTEMSKDGSSDVREATAEALKNFLENKAEPYFWLLATQKPLFATPYTPELISRMEKLEKIVQILQDKYRDEFIGVNIYGSTNKGYLGPGSDLDVGIISQNDEIAKKFLNLVEKEKLPLCGPCYSRIEVDKNNRAPSHQAIMFYGLFVGDHDRLLKLQLDYLKSINEEEWNRTRKDILDNETNIHKAQERLKLTENEMMKTKVALSLLRVPPSYQETLKILEDRYAARA